MMFDRDEDGLLNFKEWVCGLSMVCSSSLDEKINLLFRAYDRDHDGYIDKNDMIALLEGIYASTSRPGVPQRNAQELTDTMFRDLGIIGNSFLSLDDFRQAVQMEPLVAEYLSGGMFGECGEVLDVSGDGGASTPVLHSTPGEFFGADAAVPRGAHSRAASEARGRGHRQSMLRRISRIFSAEPDGSESTEDDEDEVDFSRTFGRLEIGSSNRAYYPTEEEEVDAHAAPSPVTAAAASDGAVAAAVTTAMLEIPMQPPRTAKSRPKSSPTLMQPLLSGVDLAEEVVAPQQPLLTLKPSSRRFSRFEIDGASTPSLAGDGLDAPEPNFSCWHTLRSHCTSCCCCCFRSTRWICTLL